MWPLGPQSTSLTLRGRKYPQFVVFLEVSTVAQWKLLMVSWDDREILEIELIQLQALTDEEFQNDLWKKQTLEQCTLIFFLHDSHIKHLTIYLIIKLPVFNALWVCNLQSMSSYSFDIEQIIRREMFILAIRAWFTFYYLFLMLECSKMFNRQKYVSGRVINKLQYFVYYI